MFTNEPGYFTGFVLELLLFLFQILKKLEFYVQIFEKNNSEL